MNFIEQMIKNKKDAEKTIDPRELKVYKENKQEIFIADGVRNDSFIKESNGKIGVLSFLFSWCSHR